MGSSPTPPTTDGGWRNWQTRLNVTLSLWTLLNMGTRHPSTAWLDLTEVECQVKVLGVHQNAVKEADTSFPIKKTTGFKSQRVHKMDPAWC